MKLAALLSATVVAFIFNASAGLFGQVSAVDAEHPLANYDNHLAGARNFGFNPVRPQIAYSDGKKSMLLPITVYIIWYGVWKQEEKAIINDFISGLDQSAFWKTTAKYYNQVNTTYGETVKTYVTNKVKLGRQVDDANYSLGHVPNQATKKSSGWPVSGNFDDIMQIVLNHVKAGDLPVDTNGIYLVLTDSDSREGYTQCKASCGWHTSVLSYQLYYNQIGAPAQINMDLTAPDLKFAWIGKPDACVNGLFFCGLWNNEDSMSPNGHFAVDTMLSPIAHEIAETSSNPDTDSSLTAWNDVDAYNQGYENGDNCAYIYGDTKTCDNYIYNNEWNGRKYLIQQMWDPEGQTCTGGFGGYQSSPIQECALLAKIFPKHKFPADCCNSGFADCADGHIIAIYVDGQPPGSNQTPPPDTTETGDIGTVLESIFKAFPKVQELSLTSNAYNGSIPDSICKESQLRVIGLGSNYITGKIPACIGALKNLYIFSAENNQLNGSIPASFADVPRLRFLYLSNNQLSGKFPAKLATSKRLSKLFVNGNANLEGPLPNGFSGFKGLDVDPATKYILCDARGTKMCLPTGHTGIKCHLSTPCPV